jgi:adenylate cyclase
VWPERNFAARILPESRFRRSDCERLQRRPPARNQHWAESVTRPQRVLNVATWIAAALTAGLGILQTITGDQVGYIGLINLALAGVFLAIPWLHRFGNLVAATVFVIVSYASLTFVGAEIGPTPGCSSTIWCRHRWQCWCWASSTSRWPASWWPSAPAW